MNELLKQLKNRLLQLEKDIHQIEQILAAKGHPESFTDYLLDQYLKIIQQKEAIQEKNL